MKQQFLWSMMCCLAVGTSLAADPPANAPAAVTAPAAQTLSQADLLARLQQPDPGLVVLDVRTAEEFAAGHVPGARNVAHDQIESRLAELGALKDQEVVLYCRSGRRSQLAEQTLRAAGFTRLRHLEGDYLAWEAAQRPVERSPMPEKPAP